MKRPHLLLAGLTLIGLAVIIYLLQRKPASLPDDAAAEPQVEAVDAASAPAPDSAVPAVPTPASPVPPPKSDERQSASIKAEIQGNFQTARTVFQQKAAIANAKPDEIHHMPRQTVAAAQQLGTIVELEAQHPEYATEFRDFYLECARNAETISVIRAQCLDAYLRLAKLNTAEKKEFLKDFPESILRLYEVLQ